MTGTLMLIAFAVQAAPASPPAAETQREIVVLGRKLRDWRGRYRMKNGVVRCATTKSTRDKDIDAIGCRAIVVCISRFQPRVEAMAERGRPSAERKAIKAAVERDLTECFRTTRDTLIADLADRRWQARQGTN